MPSKRKRLPADQARKAILDVAERQLARRGPDGLRLQEVAAELDISHPAILHHFGSREGLIHAVVARSVERLEQEILQRIAEGARSEERATGTLERVFEVLGDRGHARTLAWLYLARGDAEGDPLGYGDQLERISTALHRLRTQGCGDGDVPPYEETLFTVTLAGMALFGQAVAGRAIENSAGVDRKRFLRWLTRVLLDHLDGPGQPTS